MISSWNNTNYEQISSFNNQKENPDISLWIISTCRCNKFKPEADKYIKRTPSGGSSSHIVATTCHKNAQPDVRADWASDTE